MNIATDAAGYAAGRAGSPVREPALPRPPGAFRRWMAANPRKVDVIIIVCYFFGQLSVLLLATTLAGYDDEALFGLFAGLWEYLSIPVRMAVVSFALFFRRRMPVFGAIAVSIVCFFGGDRAGQNVLAFGDYVAVLVLVYSAAAEYSTKRGWIAAGGSMVAVFASWVGMENVHPSTYVAMAFMTCTSLLSAQLYGMFVGGRKRYIEALIAYAGQLAHEREQRAQLTASQERARIAREMHDIVAHSLSVVVTLSEGAQVALNTQPQAAREAMQQAASTGREALTQMRSLLGVLAPQEGKEAARAPMPQLRDIPELLQSFEVAGLRVECTGELAELLAGKETPASAGLEQTRQLAMFRVLQEALTNTLRYAGPGAHVTCDLKTIGEMSQLTVRDTGPAAQTSGTGDVQYPRKPIPGSGRGLSGARQRVEVFGGELDAREAEGGWVLCASIPQQTGNSAAEFEEER